VTQLLKNIAIHSFKGLENVVIDDCSRVNALVGKNNSGKSSILHAIDFSSFALSVRDWTNFEMKLDVQDMLQDVGNFRVEIEYGDGRTTEIASNENFTPITEGGLDEELKFKTVLILPDVGTGLVRRTQITPSQVINQISRRKFHSVNSLDLLMALHYYSARGLHGYTEDSYNQIIEEIGQYFPDIEAVSSDRTEGDVSTLKYREYGRELDILYSGSGMRHFLDVLIYTSISNADVVLLDEPEAGLHPDPQRKFIKYLCEYASNRDLQVFMATHSPVLLNSVDNIGFYRVLNRKGQRRIISVPAHERRTILGDIGLRPSDVFNVDCCLLVEGPTDVIFFEHVIRVLYKDELDEIAVGIQQYGGDSAAGIVDGSIEVSNITTAGQFTYWIIDRDAKPSEQPAKRARDLAAALEKNGLPVHIWSRRELEYYFPEEVLVAAQDGIHDKEEKAKALLHSDQSEKFRTAASDAMICSPKRNFLKALLMEHLTDKSQLDNEVRQIIEEVLVPWKDKFQT